MTSSPPPLAVTISPGYGVSVVAVAVGLLWCGVAISKQGTAHILLAVMAVATSLALGGWLWRDRQRLRRELRSQQATLAATLALCDAAVADDVEALLARGATLLGASHAWLRVEAYVGAQNCTWSVAAGAHRDATSDADTAWWITQLDGRDVYIGDGTAPARGAARLRQAHMNLGTVAFAVDNASRAWGAHEASLLRVLALLLCQLVLRQGLTGLLAESSEQSTRERRVFLAHLSHKLRTPMTAVLGFAQILDLDHELSAEHREFVREIEAAGKALLAMLNELVGVPRE